MLDTVEAGRILQQRHHMQLLRLLQVKVKVIAEVADGRASTFDWGDILQLHALTEKNFPSLRRACLRQQLELCLLQGLRALETSHSARAPQMARRSVTAEVAKALLFQR